MKKIFKYMSHVSLMALALSTNACMTNQNNLAGRINGKPISQSVFMDSYRAHYNNFQILNNRAPDNEEKDQIKLLTWRNATKHVILTSYFNKYDITVSQQEVLDTLRNSIPDYIKASAKFSQNGVFDQKIYFQSLEFDTPEKLQPLRQHYKDYLIPIMKLEKYLIRDELLTKSEKKASSRIMQSRADIDWVVLDPLAIDPIITVEEIEFYYQQNLSQYKRDPFYSIGVSKIDVIPSKEDIAFTKIIADSLFTELATGSTPETVIAKHQTEVPKLSFKNSGFLAVEALDPALYEQLSFADEGMFLYPIPIENGIAIYQLVQRTKSMVNFNTMVVPYTPTSASKSFHYPISLRLAELAKSTGLATAADEMERTYDRTGRIQPSDLWNPDTELVDQVLSQIKDKQAGYVSEPIYSDEVQAWYVVQVLDNQLNEARSLDEVRGEITETLVREKRLSMTQHLATQILAGQAQIPVSAKTLVIQGMHYGTLLDGLVAENAFFRTLKNHFAGKRQEFHALGGKIWLPFVKAVVTDSRQSVSSTDMIRLFTHDLAPAWFDKWMNSKIDKAVLNIYMN